MTKRNAEPGMRNAEDTEQDKPRAVDQLAHRQCTKCEKRTGRVTNVKIKEIKPGRWEVHRYCLCKAPGGCGTRYRHDSLLPT